MTNYFSVLLPTYNRANTLKRAIDSVLVQTYDHFELIIIDDGSTDDTKIIVDEYLKKDTRVKYLKNKINKGQNASLNLGLKMSIGNVISFIDSDDYWLADFLLKHNNQFISSTHSCIYSTAQHLVNGAFKVSRNFELEGHIFKQALAQGFVSHMITLSVKRTCFDKVGNFDEQFVVCQDDDICLRLAKFYTFGLIKEPLAVICDDGGNQTISNKKNYAIGWERLIEKFSHEILTECGILKLREHYIKAAELYLYALSFKKAFYLYNKHTYSSVLNKVANFAFFLISPNILKNVTNVIIRKLLYDK